MKIPVDINIQKRCITEETRIRACDVAENENYSYTIEGTMTVRKGYIKLNYTENDGVSIEEVLQKDKRRTVTVLRMGEIMFTLVYEPGVPYTCFFNADGKNGMVRVNTKKFENGLSELGGSIHVEYISEIVGAGAERVDLKISVAPKDGFLAS